MPSIKDIESETGLCLYPRSFSRSKGLTLFLARRAADTFVGFLGQSPLPGESAGSVDGQEVTLCKPSRQVAAKIRELLPWTAPRCMGLATSAGLGDRLGLATPGHIRAIRDTSVKPYLAQQSIREMTRTSRTPQQVMDCATLGVLEEGFDQGFGSDADHLQKSEDIDAAASVGFTMFTIDPGLHVINQADEATADDLAKAYTAMEQSFETLEIRPDELQGAYVDKTFPLEDGSEIRFSSETFLRAAVKYGNAVAHTVNMFRHLSDMAQGEFELEVSVDETEAPTSPAEHYFFANELKRLGVKWVSMAPRFVGRFEKGVDYIGDLDAFRKSFSRHVAVMRTLGPYKMSIHSGSDKFSIYPIVVEEAGGLVHLKTAGTSYLEALRAIAKIQPGLYREILDFARDRYQADKATYHVSADVAKVPPASELADEQLPSLLDDFDARQVFHVTFGSVLTAGEGEQFRPQIYQALESHQQQHYDFLEKHLGRHVAPLASGAVSDPG
jgi:hypothetical protein